MKQLIDFTIPGGFTSPLARKSMAIAPLAFLCLLGLIPGWERLLGFSGFSGFFGLAYIIEFFSRRGNGIPLVKR